MGDSHAITLAPASRRALVLPSQVGARRGGPGGPGHLRRRGRSVSMPLRVWAPWCRAQFGKNGLRLYLKDPL